MNWPQHAEMLTRDGLIEAVDRLTELHTPPEASAMNRLGAAAPDPTSLLDDAIRRARGGESVDAILADQRDASVDLRPSLELAGLLNALAPAPDPQRSLAKARVRASIVNAAQQRWAPPAQPALGGWLLRPAGFAIAAVSAIIALASGGAVVTSASSLPGEPLYAVKRAVEEVRASVASASGDQSAQAALQAEIAQRRVGEAVALVERKRPLPLGVIEAANHHAEKAEIAAARLPEARRAQVAPTLTAAHDQRAATLSRLLTSGDLPLPAQTAIAGALARADDDRSADPARKRNEREERVDRRDNRGTAHPDNRGQDNRATAPAARQGTPVVPPEVLPRPDAAGEPNRGPGNSGAGRDDRNILGRGAR